MHDRTECMMLSSNISRKSSTKKCPPPRMYILSQRVICKSPGNRSPGCSIQCPIFLSAPLAQGTVLFNLRVFTYLFFCHSGPSCFGFSPSHYNCYTKHSKKIFPEMKLRGVIPNFCIHVSVSDLYISTSLPILLYCVCGPIMGIWKSLTDTCMQKLETRPRRKAYR